jgi:hypothetical protein
MPVHPVLLYISLCRFWENEWWRHRTIEDSSEERNKRLPPTSILRQSTLSLSRIHFNIILQSTYTFPNNCLLSRTSYENFVLSSQVLIRSSYFTHVFHTLRPTCLFACSRHLCFTRASSSEVEDNLRPTVSRPVCLGVRPQSGAHDQILVFCLTIAGFLMWDNLSDEKMGL